MKSVISVLLGVLVFVSAAAQTPPETPAPSPTTPPPSTGFDRSKLFFGGYVGVSFGDVDIIEIAPRVGYWFHPRFNAGVGVTYRHTNDDRYAQSYSSNDYGFDVFGTVRVAPRMHLLAEYHWLSYEVYTSATTKDRLDNSSFFGGVGLYQPMGGRAGFYADALYNFSYDDNDPYSPYDNPWIFRVGVGIGF